MSLCFHFACEMTKFNVGSISVKKKQSLYLRGRSGWSCSSGWEESVRTCLRFLGKHSWPAPLCSGGTGCSAGSSGPSSACCMDSCPGRWPEHQEGCPAPTGLWAWCESVCWRAAWSTAFQKHGWNILRYVEAEMGRRTMLCAAGGGGGTSWSAGDASCTGCTQDACRSASSFDEAGNNLRSDRACGWSRCMTLTGRSPRGPGCSWPLHCCSCGEGAPCCRAHRGCTAWTWSSPWSRRLRPRLGSDRGGGSSGCWSLSGGWTAHWVKPCVTAPLCSGAGGWTSCTHALPHTKEGRSVSPAGSVWVRSSWLCLSAPSAHRPPTAVIGWPSLGGRTCTSLHKYTSFL